MRTAALYWLNLKATTTLCRRLALAGCLLLFILATITAVNAVLLGIDLLIRNFGWRLPILAGQADYVRVLTGPALVLFLPWCQLNKGQLVAHFVAGLFSAKLQQNLERSWCLLTAIVAWLLAIASCFGIQEAFADQLTTPIAAIAVWPFMLPVPVALTVWGFVAAMQAWLGEVKLT